MPVRILVLAVALFLAATPAPAADRPDGLYLMTRFWPNSGLETKSYLFTGDLMVEGPLGDVAAFDAERQRALAPQSVATTTFDGTTLAATDAEGARTESAIEPGSDGCFYWDAGLFCPARPFAVTALDGTWSGGASGSAALGFAQSALDLTFTPDGRYTASRAASFSQSSEASTVSGGSSGGEEGTYALSGTALTLSPEGGPPETVSAFPFGDGTEGASPEWIVFGGLILKRR